MLIIHHPDGGFFYFNNGPSFGTINIPKKNLSITAKDIYTSNLTVNGSTVLKGRTDFKGQSVFHNTMHIKGKKGTSYFNHPDGNIYLRSNVRIDQPGANDLTVKGCYL